MHTIYNGMWGSVGIKEKVEITEILTWKDGGINNSLVRTSRERTSIARYT